MAKSLVSGDWLICVLANVAGSSCMMGSIGAAVHARQVRLGVTRLDGANGGQDRRDLGRGGRWGPGASLPTPSREAADASTAVPTTAAAGPIDSPAAMTPLSDTPVPHLDRMCHAGERPPVATGMSKARRSHVSHEESCVQKVRTSN